MSWSGVDLLWTEVAPEALLTTTCTAGGPNIFPNYVILTHTPKGKKKLKTACSANYLAKKNWNGNMEKPLQEVFSAEVSSLQNSMFYRLIGSSLDVTLLPLWTDSQNKWSCFKKLKPRTPTTSETFHLQALSLWPWLWHTELCREHKKTIPI